MNTNRLVKGLFTFAKASSYKQSSQPLRKRANRLRQTYTISSEGGKWTTTLLID